VNNSLGHRLAADVYSRHRGFHDDVVAGLTYVEVRTASQKLKNFLTNGQTLAALLVPEYQIDLWRTLSDSTVTRPLTMIKRRLPRLVFFDGPDRYDAL
jgi:hypothetical protein